MDEEDITTRSVGKDIADVENDFVLTEKPESRIIFKAEIHGDGIRGYLIRQRRKSKDDKWEKEETIKITKLDKGQSLKIELPTEAISNLYDAIEKLRVILKEQGVEYGENRYKFQDIDDVSITNDNKTKFIEKIVNAGYSEDALKSIADYTPHLIEKISYLKTVEHRKGILSVFKEKLESKTEDESFWQNLFKENSWIFGYGLEYKFLNITTDQPIYTGANYNGSGDQRGDYLLNSEAEIKFTVLVEIKKPDTNLISKNPYRNGVWKLESELLWAVSQLQINCNSWFREGSKSDFARDVLEKDNIYSYQPKGILIIGNTKQLDNREKRNTFEAFRRNLFNPEIITFDELYERADFIVNHLEENIEEDDKDDDDIPF